MASVKYDDLEEAFHFVSSGDPFDTSAYIARDTGKALFWNSELDLEDELPTNVDDPEAFAVVPDHHELGLGRSIALDYAAEAMPEEYDYVLDMFRREGAFFHFKHLLSRKGLLEAWYDFDNAARKEALLEWAKSEGFSVELPGE